MNTRLDAVTTGLLGTVVAGAGWLVTHFVEDVVSIPALEYRVEHGVEPDPEFPCSASSTEVTLYNLSRTEKFSKLEFVLRFNNKDGGRFTKADMLPIPPAYVPTSAPPPSRTDTAVTYPSTAIQPKTGLKLVACYCGETYPTFHITEDSEAVRLVARGRLTWLIRHELGVAVALFLAWAGLVACFVYRGFRETRRRL